MLTIEQILGSGGRIADRLKNYEVRPQQLQMAEAVATAIRNRNHLVVEAGTGVGKSFGYLVPAILEQAVSNAADSGERHRVVVSTHTISLQEQLVGKDIPLLNSVIPLEFSAVLGKGRSNYISLRRLAGAIKRSSSLFSLEDEHQQLEQLKRWSKTTAGGSRSELGFRLLPQVWDEVQSDTSNCMGRRCPEHKECHYFRARARLRNADIIIVNHALFFVDLALRKLGVTLLPDYNTVILDEAHTIEDVASAQLGLAISNRQIDFALNRLYNHRATKGLFVTHESAAGQRLVLRCQAASEDFFGDLLSWSARQQNSTGYQSAVRIARQGIVANPLSPRLQELADLALTASESVSDESEKLNLVSASERVEALAQDIEAWRLQQLKGRVYWLESSENRRGNISIRMMAAPIDVGPELQENLFSKVDSCILTSATIAVGGGSFDFFRKRLGLANAETLKLGSPFDFSKQAKLVIAKNMADPGRESDTHERQSIDAIRKLVTKTDGHAFVLCTSYRFLRRAVDELTPWLTERSLAIYVQSTGVDRTQLLDRFRRNPRGVLFGTDSFWQGVDVQGDALRNVIIPRLPFSVPGQPLLEARLDAIRQRGGQPFREYQLPEAVIKFKQGFGRLIRSKTDSGIVAVLDPRLQSRSYGKIFIGSLPECPIESVVV